VLHQGGGSHVDLLDSFRLCPLVVEEWLVNDDPCSSDTTKLESCIPFLKDTYRPSILPKVLATSSNAFVRLSSLVTSALFGYQLMIQSVGRSLLDVVRLDSKITSK